MPPSESQGPRTQTALLGCGATPAQTDNRVWTLRLPFPRFHGCPLPFPLKGMQTCTGPQQPVELPQTAGPAKETAQGSRRLSCPGQSHGKGTGFPVHVPWSLPGAHTLSLFAVLLPFSPRRSTAHQAPLCLPPPPQAFPSQGPGPCSKRTGGGGECPRGAGSQDVTQTPTQVHTLTQHTDFTLSLTARDHSHPNRGWPPRLRCLV